MNNNNMALTKNISEFEFNLGDLNSCFEVMSELEKLDPTWRGMLNFLKTLGTLNTIDVDDHSPNLSEDDDYSWSDVHLAVKAFGKYREAIDAAGDDLEIRIINSHQAKVFKEMLQAFAETHDVCFASYLHVVGGVDKPVQDRGVLTISSNADSHAIRSYATAVVARCSTNLSVNTSPFSKELYADQDCFGFRS